MNKIRKNTFNDFKKSQSLDVLTPQMQPPSSVLQFSDQSHNNIKQKETQDKQLITLFHEVKHCGLNDTSASNLQQM